MTKSKTLHKFPALSPELCYTFASIGFSEFKQDSRTVLSVTPLSFGADTRTGKHGLKRRISVIREFRCLFQLFRSRHHRFLSCGAKNCPT